MNKRVLDSRLPVIVYNPAGVYDSPYFSAVAESGALPVFDTEFLSDDEVLAHLKSLEALSFVYGIRFNVTRTKIADRIRNERLLGCDALVLYSFDGKGSFSFPGYKIILEAVDLLPAHELAVIDPSAVIVRGFEAGGRSSRYTSFILMQWYLENTSYPVFVHGGVGFHTTPGMFAAGCTGVVLDSQLYLTEEAPLSENFKKLMRSVEEGDSAVLGDSVNRSYRFFSKLGTKITKTLKEKETHYALQSDGADQLYAKIESKLTRFNSESADTIQAFVPLGQDAVFAKHFASRSTRVSELIYLLVKYAGKCLSYVDEYDPIREGSKLAAEHGTKFPLMQGPMANVSDNADFAKLLSDAGSLPFFAMGNLPTNLAEKIIVDAKGKLENFGCGLIGLTTNMKAFQAHFELLKKHKVPYALIAAGNSAQATELEANGVKCFLHCPSATMLQNAINGGVSRFIFEGMEAGGHIGTLASFVLWEMGMEVFVSQEEEALEGQRIIFAGGLGTPSASNCISGMTSILSRKGASIGLSVGTTYLFTKEIVETGAIKPLYQKLLVENSETMVIGATLGLSTRTVKSPYSKRIIEKEYEMIREKVSLNNRKHYFEGQNIGSLLIAAKAYVPDFEKLKKDGKLEYINYDENDALEKGNFHTGESLAFYSKQLTINEAHAMFFGDKRSLYSNVNTMEILHSGTNTVNDEIAVIGMGCLYPDAPDVDTFWKNIISKKYSIKDIPDERCSAKYYFSDDRKEDDKTYTKIAGYIEGYEFDNKKYGYSDDDARHISRSQKLILDAAMQAVADAGYPGGKGLPKEKTAVIVGTCLTNELNSDLQLSKVYSEFVYHLDQIDEFKALSEDEKKGLLDHFKKGLSKGYAPKLPDGCALNIESARIVKHLGTEGPNFTIDAACATSFAAMDVATKELLTGSSDVVIVGGVNTNLASEAFVGFSKMGALSANGSYPFDERANGFVLGEGAGVIVLKRMKDAILSGDRVHAVIKSIGASSDGKGKYIAAPSPEGQKLALERAFENMRKPITPDDVDYIEAHGTSTMAGDGAEIGTIKAVYTGSRPKGVSSVKSQVGHLLGGAGNAGFIKAVAAIKNKTLPPNGGFKTISPKLNIEGTNLYVISEAKEWKVEADRKRRAAVSSYGFGGINYHVIIEEYDDSYKMLPRSIFTKPKYNHNDDRIVVAGIGVVIPGASNKDQFVEILESGKVVLSPKGSGRFHNEYYAKETDPLYNMPMLRMGVANDYVINGIKYKIPPTAQKVIDRSQFFALDAAGQVIAEAKLTEKLVHGNKIALMVGTASSEKNMEQIIRTRVPFLADLVATSNANGKNIIAEKFAARLRETYYKNTEDTLPGLLANITTGRVANFYNANGANFIIDAECAASAVAMSAAMKDLRVGTSDYVITGGVDCNLSPSMIKAFQLLKVVSSSDEAKIFDNASTGFVMSEGAALMCLTTLRRAREEGLTIYGEIDDFAFRSFPNENMIAPTEAGFLRLYNDYYGKSPLRASEVRYVDAFASSNKVVDKWELASLAKKFSKGTGVGNVKPEIGYFRTANPAVAIAKMMLMSQKRKMYPMRSFDPTNTMLDDNSPIKAFTSVIEVKKTDPLYMAANFSGLGGIHGHTLVRTLPLWMDRAAGSVSKAAGTSALSAVGASAVGPVQKAVPAAAAASVSRSNLVCALLSGQGAQYAGMMKDLYGANTSVRRVIDQGEEIFKSVRGYSLIDLMFNGGNALNSTENTQPAIFLSCAALFDALAEKGFNPDMMIGHSVGEYTALYCARILPFDEAFKLILARSSIMKETAVREKGSIMVAFEHADEVSRLIRDSKISGVYVANKNSEKQTAVSGTAEGIDSFVSYLTSKKITAKKLNLSGAFHSPLFASASNEINTYLEKMSFNARGFGKIIANVTGYFYPSDEKKVKELLVSQIANPVEFVNSIKFAAVNGAKYFIEVGPNKLLANLLKDISVNDVTVMSAVDPRVGEVVSFDSFNAKIESLGLFGLQIAAPALSSAVFSSAQMPAAAASAVEKSFPAIAAAVAKETEALPEYAYSRDFNDFLEKNREVVTSLLMKEYEKHKKASENVFFDRSGFYGGSIVISGCAVGLPGRMNRVFEEGNFDKILSGMNLIEPIEEIVKQKFVDRNIVKVHKDPQGNAKFVNINSTDDVLQLAGQLGYFDPKEYGIDFDTDITYSLAIAAGYEALKDAKIPMVAQMETTSVGSRIAKGYALPAEMQERTGVIFSAVFSGIETLALDFERLAGDKFYHSLYLEFEKIYNFIMSNVKEDSIKRSMTDWFLTVKKAAGVEEGYTYDRNMIFKILMNANAVFAQMIRAKGPNSQINAACASTTQAIGIAEDWIRTGRCDRVVIIAGEAATTPLSFPVLGAGFLALGAATVKKVVSEAAKPFDEDRNGMIVGAGAVSIVVERSDKISERGFNGQAEVLGVHVKNSAFHGSRLDVNHVAQEMKSFVEKVEYLHTIKKDDYASKLVFMSHETYTPARGGSADAEVDALKRAYPNHYKNIIVTNTKGYTGHTLSAGIEDPILVKSLQKGICPPIANLQKIPPHFADLKFSRGEKGDFQYGMHFAAGFGSQFAILFVRKIVERSVDGNDQYQSWIQRVSGVNKPELAVVNGALTVKGIAASMPAIAVKPTAIAATAIDTRHAVPQQAASAPVIADATLQKVKTIIAQMTGYGIEMLDERLDLEADLGIDTVKQVEIFGKICESFGVSVPEDVKLTEFNNIEKLTGFIADKAGISRAMTAAAAPIAVTAMDARHAVPQQAASGLLSDVKAIIAEMTGYGVEMLDERLDLEADLGIDTVKQVEIFAKICEKFGVAVPEDVKLTEMNTIDKLAGFISAKTGILMAVGAVHELPVQQNTAPVQNAVPAAVGERHGVTSSALLNDVKSVIAEMTGYGVEMLDERLDLEADLGIDTVKQVEIFAKICEKFGVAVPEDVKLTEMNTIEKLAGFISAKTGVSMAVGAVHELPVQQNVMPVQNAVPAAVGNAHAQSVQHDVPSSAIVNDVKSVIAEMTGYGIEMLDERLDLEADLGIDTVKQVEIFAKICEKFSVAVPEDVKLTEMNNIEKLAGFISEKTGVSMADGAVHELPVQQNAVPVQNAVPAAVGERHNVPSSAIVNDVKSVIAEMTGYGVEMLDERLDLEADLGIDTVKQVEIFAKICEKFGIAVPDDVKLTEYNTIDKLGGFIAQSMGGAQISSSTAQTSVSAHHEDSPADSSIARYVVRAAAVIRKGTASDRIKGKTILVTLDSKGFGKSVADKIKTLGGHAITIGKSGEIAADFTKLESVESALASLVEKNSINGLIHCAAIDPFIDGQKMDAGAVNTSVKSLFLIIKSLQGSLSKPGSFIAALSFDSVVFPYAEGTKNIYPLFGAVSGMLKSVNKEFPDTLVKALDLSFDNPAAKIDESVAILFDEIQSGDTRVEVGFRNGKRYGITLANIPVSANEPFVKEGDTLLVTGGARGITYEIIKQVVKQYHVNLVILGRSEIKVEPEFLSPGMDEKKIFEILSAKMTGSKPVEIKKAVARVMNQLDSAKNIATLESLGSKVNYHACDVSNLESVKSAVNSYSKIDGVLHAAGLEESQLIAKKDMSTFNAVYDTKVNGILNLLAALEGKSYRYMMGFSSVAARFGNMGQTDYSAANETLARILQSQKRIHPDRSYKVYDWTSWAEVGMATKESVMKFLTAQGVEFLSVKNGVSFFMKDLLDPREDEVVITNSVPAFDVDGILIDTKVEYGSSENPFLGKVLESSADHVKFLRVFDLKNDTFFHHHTRDDVPLFLGATGLETMAEAAQYMAGSDAWLLEVRDFQIPYGIKVLGGKQKVVIIEARKISQNQFECSIQSQFMKDGKPMGNATLHYKGIYVFGAKPAIEKGKMPTLPKVSWVGDLDPLLYHPQRLFMTDLFKTIANIEGSDDKSLVTKLFNKYDVPFFAHIDSPQFISDPVIVDGIFQTAGFVEFMISDDAVLPYRISKMTRYQMLDHKGEYYCAVTLVSRNDAEKTRAFNVELVDSNGNVAVRIEKFEMIAVNKITEEVSVRNKFTTAAVQKGK